MKPLILALVSLQVACVVHESKGTQPLSAEPPGAAARAEGGRRSPFARQTLAGA